MNESLIMEAAERLKLGLLAKATNGDYIDKDYKEDLQILSTDNRVTMMLPTFVKASRSTEDIQRAMQAKFKHYAERRQYIAEELQPIFEYLEGVINGTDNFSQNAEAYELGETIGNGGFGTVYKYRHKLLDYDFAVKIFEPVFVSNDQNIEGEKRFFREAKMLFQLRHNNIISVYDIGRINGKPFIRMEYVDGYTLQDFIAQNGAVSFERSKKPMMALLDGLSYAHKAGIIHRDLKPSNLMVTKDGKFKIIDFGISAYLENENHSKLTHTGESIAGGAYIDPVLQENPQLKDVRSDIYSVGAIWHYLLTGRAPSVGDTRRILLASNNATELQSLILLKCMATEPNERYQTCEEILYIWQPQGAEGTTINLTLENRLTEITREAIFDYLLDRHRDEMDANIYLKHGFQHPERVFNYSGRRDDVTFLKRLFNLQSISSSEGTFIKEIEQHTVNNNDYEYGWVFHDNRLG